MHCKGDINNMRSFEFEETKLRLAKIRVEGIIRSIFLLMDISPLTYPPRDQMEVNIILREARKYLCFIFEHNNHLKINGGVFLDSV